MRRIRVASKFAPQGQGKANMALTITRRDIEHAHALGKRALAQTDKMKEQGESIVGHISQSVEIGVGALGFGVLAGRYGAVNLGPVPLDLASGLAMHLLGFAGVAGKYADHLHNFGDGALASYWVKLGAGFGTAWRMKGGLSPFAAAAPAPGASGETARMHGGMPTSHAGMGYRYPTPYAGSTFTPGAYTTSMGASRLTEAELASMAQSLR
jgi:hypothetical protein